MQLARGSKGGNAAVQAATADGVLLDEIETQDVVQLGPQLVAMKAWEALSLSAILEELGMNPSAIASAQLLVSNRLIEPLSEWALERPQEDPARDRDTAKEALQGAALLHH